MNKIKLLTLCIGLLSCTCYADESTNLTPLEKIALYCHQKSITLATNQLKEKQQSIPKSAAAKFHKQQDIERLQKQLKKVEEEYAILDFKFDINKLSIGDIGLPTGVVNIEILQILDDNEMLITPKEYVAAKFGRRTYVATISNPKVILAIVPTKGLVDEQIVQFNEGILIVTRRKQYRTVINATNTVHVLKWYKKETLQKTLVDYYNKEKVNEKVNENND